ncbi:phytoene desaturase family protein [Cellulosilyticum sp. I15G10I2]|uniref:phytoene desaturase family protein n=1 Tax=Cellulosilyticum sp. I15G10I2 TaxID=1892843 RepID=UPI001FA78662|nr:NAD(P)/FAD-dependent oxidoreductase [Cellulosilyticum sp. I15G10I2]
MDCRYHKEAIDMKKVVVIGAGIAGLSAGIYALQSGFDVTILEQHTIPGGNCTSWKRNGYLFEGGLHWLTGSSQNTPLHQVWLNIGALTDDTAIHLKDILYTYYYNGQEVYLYRDLDKLEKHWSTLSPEDAPAVQSLCRDIKLFGKVGMPVQDIKGVKVQIKNKMSLSMLFTLIPLFSKLRKYESLSVRELSEKFKHPAIRTLLQNIVGENLTASALLFTLGCFSSGDGGYVEGGSLRMALNIAKRFTDLGGNIQYTSRAEKVILAEGKAVGVLTKGQIIPADAVIVATDTVRAIDNLFDTPLHEPWMDQMRSNVKFMADTFICLGVEADLSNLPENMLFSLEQPLSIAGQKHSIFALHNYAAYEGYAPKDCSALTTIFMGDTYSYWKTQKENGTYETEKQKVAEEVIRLLEQKLPQTAGKVSVVNVATPLTYERYCDTYHGSWMTLMEKGDKMTTYPSVSESIHNLYFAGQRIQTPGGLPVAAHTGRKAIQYLCKDTNTVFQGQL